MGNNPLIHNLDIDQLHVHVYDNRRDMGSSVAGMVASLIRDLLGYQDTVRIVFASAPSQSEFLDSLANQEGIDWSRILAFHMDEYIGLEGNDPRGFGEFLRRSLFDKVNPGTVHFIDSSGMVADECIRYGHLLEEDAIDIVCLGVGENGHIAFNDPAVADFNDPKAVKEVQLDLDCRKQQVNDGCFDEINKVPKTAITLTIPTLMSGKNLFCIVPGKSKKKAVNRMLNESISTECPASILRTHANCMLFLDKESAGFEDE